MFFQNGLTGEAWGDWSLYTDSPLRALTSAQECIAGTGGPFPEDFWDPAGITTGKSCLVDLELDGGCLKLIIFVQLPHHSTIQRPMRMIFDLPCMHEYWIQGTNEELKSPVSICDQLIPFEPSHQYLSPHG